MSIILDKGKYRLIHVSDNKSKYNYSLSKKITKNQTNEKQSQNHLLKTFIGLSPSNISTKKKHFGKLYNNSSINQGHIHKYSNNQLKYNRSFEGEILKNDLSETSIDYKLNKNNNVVNLKKNIKSNSKMNKTNIFYGNKSKTNNKINNKSNNNIIKKLDERFISLENNIIDKKYENDIDHDEMIITTNQKKGEISKSNESKNNINYFGNIINGNYNIEENLMNSSFENYKNDFKIMYVTNYSDTVPSDMLILEIKLIFEKILELQKSYHNQVENILYHYFVNKKDYKNIIKKYDIIQKKMDLLKKINVKINRKENQNCFDIYNKRNFKDINDINKEEFKIWKKMMNVEENEKNIKNKKDQLKKIFKKHVFNNFYKIKGLSDIEKKVIINLMKKNKYVTNENELKNNKSNNCLKKYSNKKILSPLTHDKNTPYVNNKYNYKKIVNYQYKIKKK